MTKKHDSEASKTPSGSRWSVEEFKNFFSRMSGSNRGSNDSSILGSMRWSLEDVKNKLLFRSSQEDRKSKKKRKNLSAEEREQRRQERLQHRKEKKSKREKERRTNVNGLFDQLGNMLGVSKDQKGQRLSILAAARDKLKEKNGDPMDNIMEEDYEDYK